MEQRYISANLGN